MNDRDISSKKDEFSEEEANARLTMKKQPLETWWQWWISAS